jgi:GTP cyclohydrolase IA
MRLRRSYASTEGEIKMGNYIDDRNEVRKGLVATFRYLREDPDREGLKDTPNRVIESYQELFSGYQHNVTEYFKTFEDVKCDEMVLVKNCEMYSTCEHHMLPFFGRAHIAYIPDGKVIGLSKLPRILEVYSRRLQIQERICEQVTEAINTHLKPKGSACIIEATHLCMCARGISKQHSTVTTSSITGVFRDKSEVRQELFSLIRG